MEEDDPTPNEAYLMRLFNFTTLRELNRFLSEPDNQEALSHMEPPYDFYDEIAKAEQESEMVEDLERLYRMSQPPDENA